MPELSDRRDIREDRSLLERSLGSYGLAFVLSAAALALQALGHLDTDVSWLITFAEKYLDGAVPYVDVTEPNMPSSFLSLVPPVLVARALGVAREPVVVLYVFILAYASIFLCGAVLASSAAYPRHERRILFNSAIFLFLITPGFAFGQREHFVLLLMAPMLALLATVDDGGQPSRPLRVLVGALAGLVIGFKPFYVVPVALPMADACWRRRSIAFLWRAESLAFLAGAAFQFLCVVVFFPAYFQYELPAVTQVYFPLRQPWLELVTNKPVVLAGLLLAGLPLALKLSAERATRWVFPAGARVCALGSAGFLLTFFLQGKGWPNHAYPAVALALFAWVFALVDPRTRVSDERRASLARLALAPALALSPVLFFAHALLMQLDEIPGLREAVLKVAPAHPRLITLSGEVVVGHPLSRQVGAIWVGRSNALLNAAAAERLLAETRDPVIRERLEGYIHQDLVGFAEDVRLHRPDVILVENARMRENAEARPETRGVLSDYAHAAQVGDIEIWRRRSE